VTTLLRWTRLIRGLARSLGILRLLRLAETEALLPPLESKPFVARGQRWRPADASQRGHVALFAGCVMSAVFSEVDRATARVLAAHGWQVTAAAGQGCCGSLHAHEGERETARSLARRNIEAFEDDPTAYVIVNAAGCGSMLKGYGHVLADDPVYADRALAFAARVLDANEFLARQEPLQGLAPLDLTVTFQDPCHLAHAQGIRQVPARPQHGCPASLFADG
jgi:glycolate oxidase iron-sulfur subunit